MTPLWMVMHPGSDSMLCFKRVLKDGLAVNAVEKFTKSPVLWYPAVGKRNLKSIRAQGTGANRQASSSTLTDKVALLQ